MKTTTTKRAKGPAGVIRSVNPFTEEVMNELMVMSATEVRSLMSALKQAPIAMIDTGVPLK